MVIVLNWKCWYATSISEEMYRKGKSVNSGSNCSHGCASDVGKILDDKVKLQAIFSICTLLEKVLPEKQKYSEVYNAT